MSSKSAEEIIHPKIVSDFPEHTVIRVVDDGRILIRRKNDWKSVTGSGKVYPDETNFDKIQVLALPEGWVFDKHEGFLSTNHQIEKYFVPGMFWRIYNSQGEMKGEYDDRAYAVSRFEEGDSIQQIMLTHDYLWKRLHIQDVMTPEEYSEFIKE